MTVRLRFSNGLTYHVAVREDGSHWQAYVRDGEATATEDTPTAAVACLVAAMVTDGAYGELREWTPEGELTAAERERAAVEAEHAWLDGVLRGEVRDAAARPVGRVRATEALTNEGRKAALALLHRALRARKAALRRCPVGP